MRDTPPRNDDGTLTVDQLAQKANTAALRLARILADIRQIPGTVRDHGRDLDIPVRQAVARSRFLTGGLLEGLAHELVDEWDIRPAPLRADGDPPDPDRPPAAPTADLPPLTADELRCAAWAMHDACEHLARAAGPDSPDWALANSLRTVFSEALATLRPAVIDADPSPPGPSARRGTMRP